VGYPTDDGQPRFVLEIRPKTNEVVVGPREALAVEELAGTTFSWTGIPPVDPTTPFDCEVQVRAHADPVPAMAWVGRAPLDPAAIDCAAPSRDELVIVPNQPIIGLSPGQTAVLYVGTRVLGQCTVERTVSAAPVTLAH
jgi:tRNA-specific 2-thiouridylase